MTLARFMRWPLITTVVALVGGLAVGISTSGVAFGLEVALLLGLLLILEISISFDNAIVNATVLRTMSERWQRIFLTWGILIAVFGMRLVFPIVIVAIAAKLSIPDVLGQAINDQEAYARNLEESNAVIASFGGAFLMLVFLNYFFDDEKEEHWFGPVERLLAKAGKVDGIAAVITLIVVFALGSVVPQAEQFSVMSSGVAGVIVYLLVNGLAEAIAPEDTDKRDVTQTVGKAGLASFLYLELLDASFSFDGVIGAFAISKNIFIIAVGLGVGALYIRSLTVYLVRQGTLAQYRFLEPGAHWAIGSLAVILFASAEFEVPEVITGLLSAVLILTAFIASVRANRRDEAEGRGEPHVDVGDDDPPVSGGAPTTSGAARA